MARRPFDPAAEGWGKASYRRGDILDRGSLAALFDGADVAVHLAFAIFGGREETRRINLEGSRNVFEAAVDAGVERLVYASSVAAYGFHPDNPQPLTEAVPARGSEGFYYSAQKAELEATLDGPAERQRGGRLRVPALRRRRAAGDDADREGGRGHSPRRPAAFPAARPRPPAAAAAGSARPRRPAPARPPRRRRPGVGGGDRRQGRTRRIQPRRRGPARDRRRRSRARLAHGSGAQRRRRPRRLRRPTAQLHLTAAGVGDGAADAGADGYEPRPANSSGGSRASMLSRP